MKDVGKLLIQEPPLQVLPTLAKLIGLKEAIVLQQVYYLLSNPRNGKLIDDKRWVFNTFEQWQQNYFPFWCVRTVKSIFTKLQRQKLVQAIQPEGRISRRKYYAIDLKRLNTVADSAKLARSGKVQDLHDGNGQHLHDPITKTSAKTSSQKGKGHSLRSARIFFPKISYPKTEDEMAVMLERQGIEYNPDYDGSFFYKMSETGWTLHGEPIWDWPAVYQARLEVTSPGA